MIGRPHAFRLTLARAAGGLMVAGATGAVLLGGASPAIAQSVPTPSPSVTSSPGLSVHLDLGLLNVHVDLPPLTSLLGGAPARPAVTRQPAAVVTPPATSTPRVVTRPSAAPVARSAAPRPASTPRPQQTRTRSSGGGAGIDSGRDVARDVRKSPSPSAAGRKAATKQQLAEADGAFERALHPGAPAWLLLTVVGACALGTAGFVRLAGRRDRVDV